MSSNPQISFTDLINSYSAVQASVVSQVKQVASSKSTASPGKFLLLQFQMSQVTQVGESISNLVSQVQTMIMSMVRAQKGG
jgi:hypothetical protein